MEKGKISDESS